MLAGVKVTDLKKIHDERGFFCELLRSDWKELLGLDSIAQTNLSMSYPGVARAWHRHGRGQIDYLVLLRGATMICIYDDDKGSVTHGHLNEIIGGPTNYQVVRIPGHYWHGTKTISDEPSLSLYFTTQLYDYTNPDEDRRPWNDSTIVPTLINNRKDEPRIGKPWDWNQLPT